MSHYNLTIYGFVEDTFLQRQPRIVINNEDDQGVGKLNSVLIDYFSSIVRLRDQREQRQPFIGFTPTGQLDILFDNMTVDYPELWHMVPNEFIVELFTILELVVYATEAQSPALNSMLLDVASDHTYVDQSVLRSVDRTNVMVPSTDGYDMISVPKWFQFKTTWIMGEESYTIHFKLYIDRELFASDYPITTITGVAPPFNPEYFFTKFPSDDVLSIISEAYNYTSSGLHETIKQVDQSGMYLFYTRYRVDVSKYSYIPFQIYYKGAIRPKDLNCRIAIKDYLSNLDIVDEQILKDTFPDLYLENSYFLVPLWDEYIVRPTRNIYRSVTSNLLSIYSKFNNVYEMSQYTFLQKTHLLLNGQNNIFTVAYANPMNSDTDVTLRDLYPTFVDYSTQEINFEYMDKKDKNFAILLNKAFAILQGELPMDAGFKYYSEDGKEYLVFATDTTEIMIVTPDSYNSLQE